MRLISNFACVALRDKKNRGKATRDNIEDWNIASEQQVSKATYDR